MLRCSRPWTGTARRTCSIALFAAAVAGPASAQVLTAPSSVPADGEGRFSYTVQFTFGPGGSYFAYDEVEGIENVPLHWIGDGFCSTWFDEWETRQFTVSGQLTDPTQPGRVRVTSADCHHSPRIAETTIQPAAVPDARQGWGTLKARFR